MNNIHLSLSPKTIYRFKDDESNFIFLSKEGTVLVCPRKEFHPAMFLMFDWDLRDNHIQHLTHTIPALTQLEEVEATIVWENSLARAMEEMNEGGMVLLFRENPQGIPRPRKLSEALDTCLFLFAYRNGIIFEIDDSGRGLPFTLQLFHRLPIYGILSLT